MIDEESTELTTSWLPLTTTVTLLSASDKACTLYLLSKFSVAIGISGNSLLVELSTTTATVKVLALISVIPVGFLSVTL